MRKLPGVQPGTIKHVILQVLAVLGPATLKDIYPAVRQRASSARRPKMYMDHLLPMVQSDILNKVEHSYNLTVDGYRELSALNELQRKKEELPITAPNRTPRFVGTYNGDELGRTSFRPGAYDAYDKPSVINGEKKS